MIGTEKIEAILNDVKELVIAAKKIKADGKIDLADLPHALAIIPDLGKFIEDFKALGAVVEEGKDIEIAEIVALIQEVHDMIKEIEKA